MGARFGQKIILMEKAQHLALQLLMVLLMPQKACLTIDEERRQQVYIIHYPYFLIIPEILL